MIGKSLGHYEIIEPIGAGGMGEVYRARDTHLDRDVAIKVLPEDFAQDAERLARFEREAKLLASLNHSNIAVIHGLEDSDGVRFIAMELVEGETIADRLAASGRIEVGRALEIARQIAEALEAAHESGIIHRDLKPANVKITPDGKVKVLDFGLAKAFEPEGSSAGIAPDSSHSPTMAAATRTGVILGTAAYMSPEQARGRGVDRRTDIWAFGCVLYEMLIGRKAFDGESVTDVLAAIVKEEADWDGLPAAIPVNIRVLLRRCLEKDPRNRLQHVGDARVEIQETLVQPSTLPPITRPAGATGEIGEGGSRRSRVAVLAGAAIGGVALGVLLMLGVSGWPGSEPGSSSGALDPLAVSVVLPSGAPLAIGRGHPQGFDHSLIAISPDGTRLAYVADVGGDLQLYLARVGELGATPLEGTEGAYIPFFSPDSQWIGFFAENELKKISVLGGSPETVCELGSSFGAAWVGDTIYFLEIGTVLMAVPAAGGRPVEVGHAEDFLGFRHLTALPGGKGLLLSESARMPISSDFQDIKVWSPETDEWKTLIEDGGYSARYAPTGHLVYVRAGGLRAVPFDLERLEVSGEPVPVLDGLRADSLLGVAQFSFADDGSLVYIPGGDMGVGVPAWVDRQGKVEPLDMPRGTYGSFSLSPDGSRLALHVGGARDDIYIYDVATGNGDKLTFAGDNGWPVWTHQGERVVFASLREDHWGLYLKRVGETDEPVELYSSDLKLFPWSWDARQNLLVFADDAGGATYVLDLDEGSISEPVVYSQNEFTDWGHQFSPDGGWLAYGSAARRSVYLSRYPRSGSEQKISVGAGLSFEPRWSRRSDELFYRNGNRWMVTTISTEPELTWTQPELLFETRFVDGLAVSYDVAPDGRFLIIKPSHEDSDATRLNLVLNWFEELERLVPVDGP